MKLEYATFSEAGVRPRNEDYIRIVEMPDSNRTMFILCDGMGGHTMGNFASRTVAISIANYWEKTPEFRDCEKKVREACRKASAVFDHKSDIMGHVHMGTTMVLTSIEDGRATIAHIGDSRCYLLRRGYTDWDKFVMSADLNMISSDVVYQTQDHVNHQFGWETVAKCFFSYRHDVAEPEIHEFEVQPGDIIFLCSDGVNKYIQPDILKGCLLKDLTAEQVADEIRTLCGKDSRDNYSGIVIQVKE